MDEVAALPRADTVPELVPGRRLAARIAAVLAGATAASFATAPVAALDLAFTGVPGDRHAGFTRAAGSREPWYPRGTVIRSRRQLSVVAAEELDEVAAAMGLPRLEPGWIGANIVVEGVPRFTQLPRGTRLHVAGGAVITLEQPNGPCRHAGAEIARHFPDRTGLDVLFPLAAKWRRGVVATVEREGRIGTGDAVEIHVPEQWVYRG